MKRGSQARGSLLVLAGVYLIYLAWEMLGTMRKGETNMQPWISVVFIVFFTLAGLGVILFAFLSWRREKEQAPEEKKQESAEDETRLTKG